MSEFENRIGGMQTFTLLDYPNKISSILFYNGCSIHCPYCYNESIVRKKVGVMDSDKIESFLKSRQGKIDAIVFSGGECTIWGDSLIEDVRKVKSMGYLVKIDTNGTNPDVLKKLISENLVDYVALDFKCPLLKHKTFFYNENQWHSFYETLTYLIKEKPVDFEVRTTVHSDIVNEDDVNSMMLLLEELGYDKTYYIQFFFTNGIDSYLDENINKHPRKFDVSKLNTSLDVSFRNIEQNEA